MDFKPIIMISKGISTCELKECERNDRQQMDSMD